MGYDIRVDGGRKIKTFTPDDTETVKYLHSICDYTLAEILDIAREKWGEKIGLEDISVTAEYVHTDCIGYDLYDPGDYTKFIVITLQTPQT